MKRIGIIAGVLLALSGGYCFLRPGITFGSLGWLIGASLLIYGIGSACAWMEARKRKSAVKSELVSAILAIALGILILVNVKARLLTDTVLIVLIGIWLAASGVLRIAGAVKLRPSMWGMGVVWGIILIVTALAFFMHPLAAVISIGYCIAFAMITQGINVVILACFQPKHEAKS